MRRIVDSLLFVLVAYTLSWPILRIITTPDAQPLPDEVAIEIRVGDVRLPSGRVRIADRESDARADAWYGEVSVAGIDAPTVLAVAGHWPIWVDVELAGETFGPFRIDAPDEDGHTIVVDLTDADAHVLFGRAPPAANDNLRVAVEFEDGTSTIAVPCDTEGHFAFATRIRAGDLRLITICCPAGNVLATVQLTDDDAVTDLGELGF